MCNYLNLDHLITRDKLNTFLLYMALQEKATTNQRKKFNSAHYDQIFSSPALTDINSEDCAIMKIKNPLGYTSMKHHLYAVQALHLEQVQSGKPDN